MRVTTQAPANEPASAANAAGNTTAIGTTALSYDARNRLSAASVAGAPPREVPSGVYFDLATWHLINTVYNPARVAELRSMRGFYAEPRHHDRLMTVVTERLGHELAARAEALSLRTNYRFSAAQAYYRIVKGRIADLRETRIEGVPTIGEFMDRRLAPAIRGLPANDLGGERREIERLGEQVEVGLVEPVEAEHHDGLSLARVTGLDQRCRVVGGEQMLRRQTWPGNIER